MTSFARSTNAATLGRSFPLPPARSARVFESKPSGAAAAIVCGCGAESKKGASPPARRPLLRGAGAGNAPGCAHRSLGQDREADRNRPRGCDATLPSTRRNPLSGFHQGYPQKLHFRARLCPLFPMRPQVFPHPLLRSEWLLEVITGCYPCRVYRTRESLGKGHVDAFCYLPGCGGPERGRPPQRRL